MKNLLLTVQSG